jgi:hypothetical protein
MAPKRRRYCNASSIKQLLVEHTGGPSFGGPKLAAPKTRNQETFSVIYSEGLLNDKDEKEGGVSGNEIRSRNDYGCQKAAFAAQPKLGESLPGWRPGELSV